MRPNSIALTICQHCSRGFLSRADRPARTCSPLCKAGGLLTPEQRFFARVPGPRTDDGCWFWGGNRDQDGYGRFWLNGRSTVASRAAYLLFVGPISPDDLCVCHSCDQPSCVNPRHLFLGTVAINNADKMVKMRYTKGADHPHSKLTEAQAREILTRLASGERPTDLAREYGVSRGLIGHMRSGRNWHHLKAPVPAPPEACP